MKDKFDSPTDETPLNTLLNIGASCDLITPVYVILTNAAAGPIARFGVLANAGFDRGDIRRLLSRNGVQSWGYIYNVAGDLIMFSVREEEATQAAEVLQRGGVPVLVGPADEATQVTRPSVALSNNVAMQPMAIVPARSIWGVLWGLVVRLIG